MLFFVDFMSNIFTEEIFASESIYAYGIWYMVVEKTLS